MNQISFCKTCFYPSNAKPTIAFDELGICSGCKYNLSRAGGEIDWGERSKIFSSLLQEYHNKSQLNGSKYDCLIPVSGGKDSHLQVWLVKEKFGLNPLLVHFNHTFNSPAGLRNLENLRQRSGCDLVIRSIDPDIARILAKEMLLEIGDITWHYHAGIMTVPFQVAVEFEIPLIIWGEHGFGELTGLVSLLDFPEFTNWKRKQYDMRGIDPKSLQERLKLPDGALSMLEYPNREVIEKLGIRGIYLSNYFQWNALEHAKQMTDEYGFSGVRFKRDRTFNLFSKIEDHANDVHDYLKFLKFGYGRATDDASMELRHHRLSRKTALELIQDYDFREPSTLNYYLDYLHIKSSEFYERIDTMVDTSAWEIRSNGTRQLKDSFVNARLSTLNQEIEEDIIFEVTNRNFYFNTNLTPNPSGDPRLDYPSQEFMIGELS